MPIPDEKARAWTRPEDYWPPRRPARRGRPAVEPQRSNPLGRNHRERQARPMLDTVPTMLLMIGLAMLAFAIIVAAWPGRHVGATPRVAGSSEIGTAPPGWMNTR